MVDDPTADDLAREDALAGGGGRDRDGRGRRRLPAAEPLDAKHAQGREAVDGSSFEPTRDMLAELGRPTPDGQVLVGFAADEGDAGLEAAREKRERKAVNLLAFNDVSRSDIGFERDGQRGDPDPCNDGERRSANEARTGAPSLSSTRSRPSSEGG